MPDFALPVVGSGPGGYVAAIHAARQGAKVAIVEERDWGGTCLNWGCIPTKALIQGVEVLAMARRAAEFGVTIPSAEPDWPVMQARKDKVVAGMRNGVQSLLKSNGVELVPGRGRLSGDVKVAVDGRDLGATNILLAPGSVPARPPIPGIEHGLTSDDLLGIKQIPSSLVIVGGGVVGMEFAGIFNTLGTRVTVIEMLAHILPNLVPLLIVMITVDIGGAILAEAALSFLGRGIPPPLPSWGGMVSDRQYMLQAPWVSLGPGIALSLTVYAWNMFGDALRDLLDPYLHNAGKA